MIDKQGFDESWPDHLEGATFSNADRIKQLAEEGRTDMWSRLIKVMIAWGAVWLGASSETIRLELPPSCRG